MHQYRCRDVDPTQCEYKGVHKSSKGVHKSSKHLGSLPGWTSLVLRFTLAVVLEQNLEMTDFTVPTVHAFSVPHTLLAPTTLALPSSLSLTLLVTKLTVELALASVDCHSLLSRTLPFTWVSLLPNRLPAAIFRHSFSLSG